MGETRGNQGVVDGVDGHGDVDETPLSSSPAMTEPQPGIDDDRLGPFQVVEVRDTPATGLKARWLDRLGDRRQPAAFGVALGLVVSVVAIGTAGRSQTANQIGSALLPAAWSAPDGVDSASGGGNDDGGRSTFSRLLFGGDTDENVSEDDDGARDEDAADLVADERSDVDDSNVSAEGDSTDGESADGDSTGNDSTDNDSTGNETAGADTEAGVIDSDGQGEPGDANAGSSTSTTEAGPGTTVGGPTSVSSPTSVATTRPSSTTPTTASTTTEATVPSTTVATSTTTTTTSRPTVAAPTGCEVQTSTSGVRTTGVEIHEPSEEFARRYVLYDADLREVIRVSEPQQVEGPEIEFESEAIGFDADVIHYAAAVSEGVVSAPTACERRV